MPWRRVAVRVAVCAVCVAAIDASGEARQDPALETLLSGEPTPGSMALLVRHVARPEAHQRLAAGLRDPRADVRAAAARVIHVVAAKGLVTDLAAVLATERDADPALEIGRALAALGGPAHDAAVADAWARVPSGSAGRVAVPFARVRGVAALDLLPRLRDTDASAISLTAYVVAARPDAAALDGVLASALESRDALTFGAALEAARELTLTIDDKRLVAALAPAQAPALRLAAARQVFRRWRPGREPSAAVQAALAADAPFSDRDTLEARVARVFVHRAAGRPVEPPADWRAIFQQPSPLVVGFVMLPGVDRLLTSDERKWLGKSLPNRRDAATPDLPAAAAPAGPVVTLLDGFPEGYVPGVMRATGCDLGRAAKTGLGAGAGQLTLQPDGRVSRVSRIDTGVAQAACALATDILLMTAIAPVRPAAGAGAIAVLPFEPGYLECRERQAQDIIATGLTEGSRFEPPKKIRHVNPVYPRTALDARVQGTVVVRSAVGTQGCPSQLQIVSSVDPRLDLAALLAVSGWRFAPTRIDGTAVPVEMTVTVSFSVQ